MRIDLIQGMVKPFRTGPVWDLQPLRRPFVRPVALYSSKCHSLLGYRIGIFDDAVPPEVRWRGLQSFAGGNVLITDLKDWERVVKEYLGEYIADG